MKLNRFFDNIFNFTQSEKNCKNFFLRKIQLSIILNYLNQDFANRFDANFVKFSQLKIYKKVLRINKIIFWSNKKKRSDKNEKAKENAISVANFQFKVEFVYEEEF